MYYALCEQDFTEVAGRSTRCTPRRSQRPQDGREKLARLAELFECGLLPRVLHPGSRS